MKYHIPMIIADYDSPLGKLIMGSDDNGATLSLLKFADTLPSGFAGVRADAEIFGQTRRWLDAYFSKNEMPPMPPVSFRGTPFQIRVWKSVSEIPYGTTLSYGELAAAAGTTCARAAGRAVGSNPLHVIVPCHRVIAASGALTGYAGGIERKQALLKLESVI